MFEVGSWILGELLRSFTLVSNLQPHTSNFHINYNLYKKYLIDFQPHTYTRTLSLWDDFLQVFAKVPNLVFYKTFAARGKPIVGGRALDLSRALQVKYFASPQQLLVYLKKVAPNFDAIILCGAGDVVSGSFLRQASFVTFD